MMWRDCDVNILQLSARWPLKMTVRTTLLLASLVDATKFSLTASAKVHVFGLTAMRGPYGVAFSNSAARRGDVQISAIWCPTKAVQKNRIFGSASIHTVALWTRIILKLRPKNCYELMFVRPPKGCWCGEYNDWTMHSCTRRKGCKGQGHEECIRLNNDKWGKKWTGGIGCGRCDDNFNQWRAL